MKNRLLTCVSAVILTAGLNATAHATLIDRGNGMIYDSAQDITWLQDANYALTSGYAAANVRRNGRWATDNIFANGKMGWDAAITWADNLVYGGYSDWRLASVTDRGNDGCNRSFNGTDCGFNVDTSGSELAYMWYNILGNTPYYDTSGNGPQSGWGLTSTTADGIDLLNLRSSRYWSGTQYAPNANRAWLFNTRKGFQRGKPKRAESFAWAVRSGDVATVAEPGTLLLLAAGLVGIAVTRRKRC
ncbi:MAG: DUF1566 domain-containing protein [Gammaproteobacteria bacterium]|nr:DUF1566 domain-containing protein [Gammaproteobacteria bacterium]